MNLLIKIILGLAELSLSWVWFLLVGSTSYRLSLMQTKWGHLSLRSRNIMVPHYFLPLQLPTSLHMIFGGSIAQSENIFAVGASL